MDFEKVSDSMNELVNSIKEKEKDVPFTLFNLTEKKFGEYNTVKFQKIEKYNSINVQLVEYRKAICRILE